jgi:hypothetical protein
MRRRAALVTVPGNAWHATRVSDCADLIYCVIQKKSTEHVSGSEIGSEESGRLGPLHEYWRKTTVNWPLEIDGVFIELTGRNRWIVRAGTSLASPAVFTVSTV